MAFDDGFHDPTDQNNVYVTWEQISAGVGSGYTCDYVCERCVMMDVVVRKAANGESWENPGHVVGCFANPLKKFVRLATGKASNRGGGALPGQRKKYTTNRTYRGGLVNEFEETWRVFDGTYPSPTHSFAITRDSTTEVARLSSDFGSMRPNHDDY